MRAVVAPTPGLQILCFGQSKTTLHWIRMKLCKWKFDENYANEMRPLGLLLSLVITACWPLHQVISLDLDDSTVAVNLCIMKAGQNFDPLLTYKSVKPDA